MKKHILSILMLALLCAGATSAESTSASTPAQAIQSMPVFPDSLPTGSLGALRKNALERVKYGFVSAYSQSIRYESGSVTTVTASGSSPNAILAGLTSQSFQFNVTNANDWCSVWSQLSDGDGNVLFYGGNGFYPEKVATNSYRIPASAKYNLELGYWVPLYVGAVDSATILFRDSSGNIQWQEEVKVYNGYLQFPQTYAGRNGEIILRGGGYTAAYSLKGDKLPDIYVGGNTLAVFENYKEVNDSGLLNGQDMAVTTLIDITATNYQQPPVVRVEIKSTRKVNLLTVVGKNSQPVEYAQIASVRANGEAVEVTSQCQQGSASFTLQPGVYWISFNDLASLQRNQPQPPYGGGQG